MDTGDILQALATICSAIITTSCGGACTFFAASLASLTAFLTTRSRGGSGGPKRSKDNKTNGKETEDSNGESSRHDEALMLSSAGKYYNSLGENIHSPEYSQPNVKSIFTGLLRYLWLLLAIAFTAIGIMLLMNGHPLF